MFYNRLNDLGTRIAKELADEQGLDGVVSTDLTPYGKRAAFFRLSQKAIGAQAVDVAAAKLKACGFEPDVLFMGYPVELHGGFIGKSFSDIATARRSK